MDSQLIKYIIEVFLICWFVTNFEPFLNFKIEYIRKTPKKNKILFYLFDKITSCIKCLSFWISIIYCLLNEEMRADYIYNVLLTCFMCSTLEILYLKIKY